LAIGAVELRRGRWQAHPGCGRRRKIALEQFRRGHTHVSHGGGIINTPLPYSWLSALPSRLPARNKWCQSSSSAYITHTTSRHIARGRSSRARAAPLGGHSLAAPPGQPSRRSAGAPLRYAYHGALQASAGAGPRKARGKAPRKPRGSMQNHRRGEKGDSAMPSSCCAACCAAQARFAGVCSARAGGAICGCDFRLPIECTLSSQVPPTGACPG
jgi:hypothetical protein